MTIDVYPSQLPGEPLERHEWRGTLGEWLLANVPDYVPGDRQPITASCHGHDIPPEAWGEYVCDGRDVELRPVPRAAVGAFIAAYGWYIAAAAAVLYVATMSRAMPKMSTGVQGRDLASANIKANTPRLNEIVPEIAGRFRVFPDYLCQPRRYFVNNKQFIDVMLCVGVGEYAIDPNTITIGETPLVSLGDAADYAIYGPGADVSGHLASRNWYSAPEVGATTGSAGLRLTAGAFGTPSAQASVFRVNSNTITYPTGAGVAPQDWEVGNIVSIVARIRTIEVVDGGGSWFARNRDYVRGSFGDLGLAVNDMLSIDGGGVNDGLYRVQAYTASVSVPGTPSTVTAVRVAPLDFLADPVSLQIGLDDVLLDVDYLDHDALVAAINAQIAGVVASHVGGVITLTEGAPYSGQPINLAGFFDPLFGASPTSVTGTATQSYGELRLDKWVRTEENGGVTYGWEPAGSMQPGVFAGVEVQKPRVMANSWLWEYEGLGPTQYRITSIITGSIPDGAGGTMTGTVGWGFQRLSPNGTDDAGWTGFAADVESSNVIISLDGSQITGGWLGPFRATPTAEKTSLLEFDVFAPQGIGYVDDKGRIQARTKAFDVQWRANGGAWTNTSYSVRGRTRDQLGWTFQISLPSDLAHVDVRVRRVGAEQTDIKSLDRLEWYGLRSLLAAPSSYAGVTTMALTLEGSDVIASRTENQISMIVTRKLGGVATRGIAPWVRYVAQSVGYGAGDINEDALSELEALWTARGDHYDWGIIDQTTVKDALAGALRVGMAELTIDQGQIRPVRDQARSTFEHLYTPQNMTSPLRRSVSMYDPDEHDGVDVEYVDASTWETETVQCRLPGDAAVRVEKITVDGVTDRTRAWRIGMRERRLIAYRRKSYSFSTEWDALNSRYLSYCALTDDVPGYGQSARLDGITAVTGGYELISSEQFAWTDGATHVVALRREDGTLCGPFEATRVSDFTLRINGELDFDPVTGGAVEPTHLVFGTSTRWSFPVLVTEISPGGDTVEVTAVNYDPRVYLDDDNSPPA